MSSSSSEELAPVFKIMKLKFFDRIVIGNILPKTGDFLSLSIKQDIVNKIKLNKDEIDNYQIKVDSEGTITWKEDVENEIELTDTEKAFIKSELSKIESNKSLTDDTFKLYNLFFN